MKLAANPMFQLTAAEKRRRQAAHTGQATTALEGWGDDVQAHSDEEDGDDEDHDHDDDDDDGDVQHTFGRRHVQMGEATAAQTSRLDDMYAHHDEEEELQRLQEESEVRHFIVNPQVEKRRKAKERAAEYEKEVARQGELQQQLKRKSLAGKAAFKIMLDEDRERHFARQADFLANVARPKTPPKRKVRLTMAERLTIANREAAGEVFIAQAESTEGSQKHKRAESYLASDKRAAEDRELARIALVCLRGRLKDISAKHREAACMALGTLNCDAEDIADDVAVLLDDQDASVAKAARLCLRSIGGAGTDALKKHDQKAFGKLRVRIVRMIAKHTYYTALLAMNAAATGAAFKVNADDDANFKSNIVPTFFAGGSTDPDAKLEVKQIDVADYMKNHMLATDRLDAKLEDEHEKLMEQMEKKIGLRAADRGRSVNAQIETAQACAAPVWSSP